MSVATTYGNNDFTNIEGLTDIGFSSIAATWLIDYHPGYRLVDVAQLFVNAGMEEEQFDPDDVKRGLTQVDGQTDGLEPRLLTGIAEGLSALGIFK